MADVALDPLYPIQLGHVGIHHPFDEVVLRVAEKGALPVPQILEILESLHFAFPPEGYRSEKRRLSGVFVIVRLLQPRLRRCNHLVFGLQPLLGLRALNE